MAANLTRAPLRTGGNLWGPLRVREGISLRQLSAASGVHRGLLSLMESGRMTPTGDEYDRIQAALATLVRGEPAA